MPKKKSVKSKNRKAANASIQPRWILGAVLVIIVAIVGMVVVRLSQASAGVSGVMFAGEKNTFTNAGSAIKTDDGTVWRTSVNEVSPVTWQFYGPYEKLTIWPDKTEKGVSVCFTIKDNLSYGVRAEYVIDIASADALGGKGNKILASKSVKAGTGSFKSSSNGYEVQCVDTTFDQAQGFPYDIIDTEYRVRVEKGSIDILQAVRNLKGTVTSSVALPTSRNDQYTPIDGGDGLWYPAFLGAQLPDGYYRMPESPLNEYSFHQYTNGSGDLNGAVYEERCGSKKLVGVAYTMAVNWIQAFGDNGSRVEFGDFNAIDHKSHRNGVDVDLRTTDSSAANTKGDRDKSIQLGKWLVDTGVVKLVLYNDTNVRNAVNSYAKSKGQAGDFMQAYPGHDEHFHVRLLDQYRLPDADQCTG